jgi:anti-sigma factor RsiW
MISLRGSVVQCDRVRDCLSAYVDGELSPELNGQVDSHLNLCGSCASSLAAIKRLGEFLGSVAVPDVPVDLVAKTLARAQSQGQAPAAQVSWRKRWIINPIRIAAACLAGLSVGLTLSRQLWDSRSEADIAVANGGEDERSSHVFLGAEEESAKQLVAAMIPTSEMGD